MLSEERGRDWRERPLLSPHSPSVKYRCSGSAMHSTVSELFFFLFFFFFFLNTDDVWPESSPFVCHIEIFQDTWTGTNWESATHVGEMFTRRSGHNTGNSCNAFFCDEKKHINGMNMAKWMKSEWKNALKSDKEGRTKERKWPNQTNLKMTRWADGCWHRWTRNKHTKQIAAATTSIFPAAFTRDAGSEGIHLQITCELKHSQKALMGWNKLGNCPAANLVSPPLTLGLKVICWESLMHSLWSEFVFPYNISSEEFQGQCTERSQPVTSSNQINSEFWQQ